MGDKNYAPDTFTEQDVKGCLDFMGFKWYDKGRYILSQCPTHDDNHPSVQIYKDDWFVNCHAGCGRYHITKAFPELLNREKVSGNGNSSGPSVQRGNKEGRKVTEREYTEFDQMEYWKSLPDIPRDHQFKSLPLSTLDVLGWKWIEDKNSYYIPYFNRPRTKIPFSQLRHLAGERRFTFLKDAKPTLYGTWHLIEDMGKIFVVEGASDAAVLETCGIPWIAAPSAASSALIGSMVVWAVERGIEIVYAGDNDEAGDSLKAKIDELVPYRVKQPREPYKDWGEMYEAEGYDSVRDYCMKEIDPTWENTEPPKNWSEMSGEEKILYMFPGAKVLEIKQ